MWYNGHGGKREDGTGYWGLNGGWITGKGLARAIDEVAPGTAYLVNDSCYAEAVDAKVKPTNSTVVSVSACADNTVSWASSSSGGVVSSHLKKNLRDCNSLQKSFDKAEKEIGENYAGKAEAKHRQKPVLHNEGKVDLSGKPWNDPTGFGDRVAKVAKTVSTWLFGGSATTAVLGSYDPNDKTGPAGAGGSSLHPGRALLPYTVYFENKATAQVPAQEVLIVDSLDPNLDWSTFELGGMAFNDTSVTIPRGLQQYTGETYVGTDPNPVRIEVSFDPATGATEWYLRSVDPLTQWLPDDPYAGFLPPNDATHRGEGWGELHRGAQGGAAVGNGAAKPSHDLLRSQLRVEPADPNPHRLSRHRRGRANERRGGAAPGLARRVHGALEGRGRPRRFGDFGLRHLRGGEPRAVRSLAVRRRRRHGPVHRQSRGHIPVLQRRSRSCREYGEPPRQTRRMDLHPGRHPAGNLSRSGDANPRDPRDGDRAALPHRDHAVAPARRLDNSPGVRRGGGGGHLPARSSGSRARPIRPRPPRRVIARRAPRLRIRGFQPKRRAAKHRRDFAPQPARRAARPPR